MISKPYPGIILFIIALAIGICCYQDYGGSWDESIQRGIGVTTFNYIFHNDQSLKSTEFQDLGTGFELPLVFIEKGLHLTDTRDIYMMRRLATFIFFIIGAFCGYLLALRLFRNQLIACMGFIMLAFQPRLFAHAYFNTKDIPFVASFIIVFMVAQVAFEKNRCWLYFALGIACGYATSIRAMGILFLPCFSVFFLADFLAARRTGDVLRPHYRNYTLYITGFCAMLYAAWPILWSNPIHNFAAEFKRLAHINWEGEVLFHGQNIRGSQLPISYIPTWFAITMPELWLLAGLAGVAVFLFSFARKPAAYFANTPERNFLLYLGCFAGPPLAVVVLNSVNYDDWRHLYFIYPGFIMFALYGFHKLFQAYLLRVVALSLFCLQAIVIGVFMVSAHPFQQVYFNNLVSHKEEYLRHNYDVDYWQVGYVSALEYIAAHDQSAQIRVTCPIGPLYDYVGLLRPEQRRRFVVVGHGEQPDYFITNFKNHPEEEPYPHIIYGKKVLNSTITRIYKLR